MANIGDKVMIIHMDGEPNYSGRVGVVTSIDAMGQLHGTWGGLAIVPEVDDFRLIEED